MGITNMAATIPGFLVPAVVGALTHGKVINMIVKDYLGSIQKTAIS